jgi:hypothetical protein
LYAARAEFHQNETESVSDHLCIRERLHRAAGLAAAIAADGFFKWRQGSPNPRGILALESS